MENVSFEHHARELGTLNSMRAIYLAHGDSCKLARVGSWRANCFDALGQLDSAIVAAQHALTHFTARCDSIAYMSIQVNLGNTLLSLGEPQRVLDISEAALALWNDDWPYAVARNGLYSNRAIALAYLGDMPASQQGFRDALLLARREGVLKNELDAYANLGALFGMMAEGGRHPHFLDSLSYYSRKALGVLKRMEDQQGMMLQYSNLAGAAKDRKRYREALQYLDSTLRIARPLGRLDMRTTVAGMRADSYRGLGRLDSALFYLQEFVTLKDSLLNTEKVKAIADVQEKYESEKKARTITELQVQKLDSDLRQEGLKRTRNIYLFTGIGVLMMAGGLWSRLRYVHRSRAAIRKEKEVSEGLLLNILPGEVAEELKAKGSADAQLFDQVTVLFTDFKGFTALSELLGPKELVRDIHECFSAFDHIMARYGIEKIKTIGDAYMAAGGLPTPNASHARDAIMAALEIRDFIELGKAAKVAMGLPFFEIRIGIHTGPVVAGIVGVKKFQYDIWGDTVNTASRMESSGEVGRVNISEATHALVKDLPGLVFTPRGRVQAKGKGEMEMFFVERAM
ncbi:MAG: hypothetical protein KIT10_01515 [Flavobacteriales bacterium]|nr:hypothetical protein [Flavobacteriales bacterium]